MAEQDIRATILKVYKRHREEPDAPFDDLDFLTYLVKDRASLQDLRNGFAGLKRLNKFYDDLQAECGVLLEGRDTEHDWPLHMLTEHIAEKKSNRSAQKALATRRLQEAEARLVSDPVKFGLLLFLPGAVILWTFIRGWTAAVVLLLLALCGVFAIWRVQKREVDYYRRMKEIIGGKE